MQGGRLKGRSSAVVRLARAVQWLPLGGLHSLERPWLRESQAHDWARPIFLLALPRSGSTLSYQALIHATDALYLSNLWNFLYFLPLAGGKLSLRRCDPHASDFRSAKGFVPGLCGPAEGLRFWSYWLGHGMTGEQNERLAGLPQKATRSEHLRRVFAVLCGGSRSLVTGYIGHCLVADELARMFPEALFVRLRRDPLDNALSILRIMRAEDIEAFSVMPSRMVLPESPTIYDRVAAQVDTLNKRLDRDLDPQRTVELSYEGMCQDPSGEIAKVVDFCNSKGFPLRRRAALPPRFERSPHAAEWLEHKELLGDAFARRARMDMRGST